MTHSRLTGEPVDVASAIRENKAWWDEKGPLHAASIFYDFPSILAGGDRLGEHEIDEMGPVEGKTLLHLQCHLGTETIGWARRGAEASGLDFSKETVKRAKLLAAACGVSVDYRLGNVYDAEEVFEGKKFDRVYVNIGSLHYLPDIKAWGNVVMAVLKEGGQLYVDEIHPISSALSEESPTFIRDYFDVSGETFDEEGSYADVSVPTKHNRHTVWDHTLGDIVNAVIGSGMRLDFLNERPGGEYQQFPYQTQGEDGLWHNPLGLGVFPSMFSLKATKV